MDEPGNPLTEDEIVTTPSGSSTPTETGDADTDDTDVDTDDADTDDTDADTDDPS